MNHYKYGVYIDLKNTDNQLLKHGVFYAATLGRLEQTLRTSLWLLGAESAEAISPKDVIWHQEELSENTYKSRKYVNFITNETKFVEYYFRKTV